MTSAIQPRRPAGAVPGLVNAFVCAVLVTWATHGQAATLSITGTTSASSLVGNSSASFNGGTLQLNQSAGTLYNQAFSLLAGVTGTIDAFGDSATFSGVFSGAGPPAGGPLVITNTQSTPGIVTFSQANTYTGATTVTGPVTLALTGSGGIAVSSGLTLTNHGAFDISGTLSGASINTLAGDATSGVNLGIHPLRLTAATGTFGGVIAGTALSSGTGLSVQGGTEILTGANTYTGRTIVSGGATLALSGSGSIVNTNVVTLNANGVFDISGTNAGATVATLSTDGTGTVRLGQQTLTLTLPLGTATFNGVIADGGRSGGVGGSLSIDHTGGVGNNPYQVLGGVNTYTGATTVTDATLQLTGAGSIADSSGVTLIHGGELDVSGVTGTPSIKSLAGDASTVVTTGSSTPLIITAATGGTFSGMLQAGAGLWITGGTQTFDVNPSSQVIAPIEVGDGTHAATLAMTGGGVNFLNVNPNAVLDISGATSGAAVTGGLAGGGTVTLGNQTLSISACVGAQAQCNQTFSGVIQGSGGVTMEGGSQTLSGINTYTGLTTVGQGTTGAVLSLAGTGTIAASSGVAVQAAGVFDISGTSAGASIKTLADDGSGDGSGTVTLGMQTLTITAGSTSFGGVIQGGGGNLTVSGGTETLYGTNTYSGATTVTGATLALTGTGSIATSSGLTLNNNGVFDISGTTAGASIQTLADDGSGTVILGGQTLTLTNQSTSFTGLLTGNGGGLDLAGGTLTLMGSQPYTGATTIGGGVNPATLLLTGGGSIAASSGVTLATGGVFDISGTSAGASIQSLADDGTGTVNMGGKTLTITNGSGTFSGVLTDGGAGGGSGASLAVTGGTETLGGTNTYTGATTIGNGTTPATLALTGGGSIATSSGVTVNTNGTFDISATSAGASIATLAGAGGVNLGGQTLTLTNQSTAFTGVMTGTGGGLDLASGALTLTGSQTYTGQTTVGGQASATLHVNGSLASPVVVNLGGVLRGTGAIGGGVVVNSGGTLDPGNSPGTLTVGGAVSLGGGSNAIFEFDGTGTGNGAGNFSRLVVTGGSVALGGTLTLLTAGTINGTPYSYALVPGHLYQIITASGGVTGAFSGIVPPTGLPGNEKLVVMTNPDDVTVEVLLASYVARLTQYAPPDWSEPVAAGLDAGRPPSGTVPAIYSALDAMDAPTLLTTTRQMAPLIYGDAALANGSAFLALSDRIEDALAVRRGAPAGRDMQTIPAEGLLTDTMIWVTATGGFQNLAQAANGTPGYNGSLGGTAAGIDAAPAPGTRLGLAFGFTSLNLSDSLGETFNGQAFQVQAYGAANLGRAFLDGQLGVAANEGEARRTISALSSAPRGNTMGTGAGGSVRAGTRLPAGTWTVEPSAGLSALSMHTDGLTETQGGEADETIGARTLTSLRSSVNLAADRRVGLPNGWVLLPMISVGWTHEMADNSTRTAAAFTSLPGTGFTIASAPAGRDALTGELRARLETGTALRVFAGYGGAVASRSTTQSMDLGVSYMW